MSSSTVYRLSGISLFIGGLLAAIGTVGQAFFSNLFSPMWTIVSASHYIGLLLILLGLPAVYTMQMKRAGTLGLIGFILFFTAFAQFGGSTGVVDIVALPWLTKINAFNTTPLSFILFFLLVKLFLLVGSVVFSIAMLRTGIFPKGSVILLIVGAVLFLFGGRVHIIPYLDYLGEVLFLMAFVWFGTSLLSQPHQEREIQQVAVPDGTEARV
jgi:hypothetical protein